MYNELNEIIKNISVVSDQSTVTKLSLPYGLTDENYITYIKSLLNFIELNCITINAAQKLFQDGINILEYHECIFGDIELQKPTRASKHCNGSLKYCMYEEHNFTSIEFINKYKLYYAPQNISQEIYFEMLLQLDDFVKDNGLTIQQAQNLFSDCAKMLLQSK